MIKLNALNSPIGHWKIWWQLHWMSFKVFGDWFGVKVHLNGKIEFINDALYQRVVEIVEEYGREVL